MKGNVIYIKHNVIKLNYVFCFIYVKCCAVYCWNVPRFDMLSIKTCYILKKYPKSILEVVLCHFRTCWKNSVTSLYFCCSAHYQWCDLFCPEYPVIMQFKKNKKTNGFLFHIRTATYTHASLCRTHTVLTSLCLWHLFQYLSVEEPVRRKCRTISQTDPNVIVRGFQLLPSSVDFGTLQEGTSSAITVVMKNVGVDTCR